MIDQHTMTSDTGAALHVLTSAPIEPPIAIVQINHGLAEHAGRYERFMTFLAESNIAAVVHDHRGHGKTAAPDAARGVFADKDGDQAVAKDAAFLARWAQSQWPDAPLIIFGHSMGGLVALATALELKGGLEGLAIWNANLAMGPARFLAAGIARLEGRFGSATEPSKIIPRLTFDAWDRRFADEGPASHWLSRDKDEVQKYIDDPDCGFSASPSLWRDVFRLAGNGEDHEILSQLSPSLPIQLVAGGQDPATEGGKATVRFADRLQRLGQLNVSVAIDPDARHETLNDLSKDAAMDRFVEWVGAEVVAK